MCGSEVVCVRCAKPVHVHSGVYNSLYKLVLLHGSTIVVCHVIDKHYLRRCLLQLHCLQVHNALGFCYFSMEKVDMAIAEYRKAVDLQQGYVTAWNNLGDAYERSKDWK